MDSGNDATKPTPPLPGYNTNVRHRGRLFHIQTEDSGVLKPHVTTHLFTDGGRVVASRKTSYEEHLGTSAYPAIVKQLMKEQHKAMFVELRDGVYDTVEDDTDEPTKPRRASDGAIVSSDGIPDTSVEQTLDIDALDQAAARLSVQAHGSVGRISSSKAPPGARLSSPSNPGRTAGPRAPATDSVAAKSLDEVILGFLARELDRLRD